MEQDLSLGLFPELELAGNEEIFHNLSQLELEEDDDQDFGSMTSPEPDSNDETGLSSADSGIYDAETKQQQQPLLPGPVAANLDRGNKKAVAAVRSTSDSDDSVSAKRRACLRIKQEKDVPVHLSKNAVAARENRLKKKRYVQDLEDSVERLRSENERLKSHVGVNDDVVGDLRRENLYLRNVLANSSEISSLLKNVLKTPGVEFGSSLETADGTRRSHRGGKRSKTEHAKDVGKVSGSKRARNEDPKDVGVCLHVSNKKVSVEFCPTCNDSAYSFWDGK